MSYLGRSAKLSLKAQEKVSFLATAGQTVKTGLSYTPSFIEVYVNGVLLTDTTDFTATNGNSITFTVALLLNDEVTVISLKTFTVADHYTKSDADTLLAAKATNTALALKAPIASPSFTGNGILTGANSADFLIKAPTDNASLTLQAGSSDSGAEGSFVNFVQNTDYKWQLGMNTDNSFRLYSYGASAEVLKVDSAGIVTKPLQPAFLVQAGSNSALPLLVGTKVNFDSEIFDQNSDFNTTTQTFTAPVTGKYQFNVQLLWLGWDSGAAYYYLQIVTSNRTYYELYSGAERSSDPSYCYGHIHVLADMDAGDTAHVSVYQNQGISQTTYDGQSLFTGHLAC
jgi:hypothetical protein